MNSGVRPAVKGAPTKSGTGWVSPRLLLIFSSLLVMAFFREGFEQTALKVGALLLAAASASVALFRPLVVVDRDRLRRAEHALLASLLFLGLISTAGLLAQSFADLASPLWLMVASAYAVLGLLGALLLVRRTPKMKWALPLLLLAHAVITVVFLRSTPAHQDVQVFLSDSAVALLHGQNPYSITFPNIFRSPETELFYGPGVVVDGRITYGFPYLPVSLLVALPGQLLGDVRYGQLIAMTVTALVLYRLASDRIGRTAAVLGVAAPAAIPVLTGAWTEPTLVALLACLVLALERRQLVLGAALLGLFLVSKQYVVIAIPAVWLLRPWLTRRTILTGLGVAAAVTLPFFLVDPPAFWKAIVEFQLIQPFRADSVSLLVASVNAFGWPPPWTYGVLPFVGGGLTALTLALLAPRSPAAFAGAIGLTLLVTILLSKQAFMNYYFLVSGAFLIAAVAWPGQPEPVRPAPQRSKSS